MTKLHAAALLLALLFGHRAIAASPTIVTGAQGSSHTTNTCTQVLNTTPATAPILILVFSAIDSTSGTNTAITSVASPTYGAFTRRAAISNTYATGAITQEEWYLATTNVSVSETLTITYAATVDNAACILMVVQGFGPAAAPYFDPNPGLPYTNQASTNAAPTISGVSTTNPDDLLILGMGWDGNAGGTLPAGFTQSRASVSTAGTNDAGITGNYNSLSATVTGQTYTYAVAPTYFKNFWTVILDAVTADAPAAGAKAGPVHAQPF